MKRRQATGFTVIELAVIIVVIGILATIILVVYNRAQTDARDSKRANDARVIDAALNKYFDANGCIHQAAAALATRCKYRIQILSTPKPPRHSSPLC